MESRFISRRTFLGRLGSAAGAAVYGGHVSAVPDEPKRPPNFVFIFTDDQGYGDLGCYGATDLATPGCDRMAAEGLRFDCFYAAAPVCTPSRAALLTGRYPVRTGLTHVLRPHSGGGIDASEITLAEALKTQGYATACIGKWHLGHRPEHLPTRHGFDSFFGLPYSNDMSKWYLREPPIPLLRDEEVIEQPVNQATLTRRYTEESVRFIREHRDEPFFLYLAHTMPHVPLAVSPEFKGTSSRGLYGDVVQELDWSTGQILDTLKEEGLDDNTLVVYTSDNGPWLWMGRDGGGAGPLSQGKGSTFEGGMRVPCIVRWPGMIAPGRVEREFGTMLDWFPTFIKLAGGSLPGDRVIDGHDLRTVLDGTGSRANQEFYYFSGDTLQAYRSGPWKLKQPFSGLIYTTRIQHPRLLINLADDPGERHNLAHAHPDLVKEMALKMHAFSREVRQT